MQLPRLHYQLPVHEQDHPGPAEPASPWGVPPHPDTQVSSNQHMKALFFLCSAIHPASNVANSNICFLHSPAKHSIYMPLVHKGKRVTSASSGCYGRGPSATALHAWPNSCGRTMASSGYSVWPATWRCVLTSWTGRVSSLSSVRSPPPPSLWLCRPTGGS